MSFIKDLLSPSPKANHQTVRPITNELLPDLKDAVFRHQIQTPNFPHLDEEAIILAEITPTKHKATQILHSAHKIGLISPSTGRPDTTKVTSNMVHHMPVLGGISKQREFVMLLFFWEEEVRRWDVLEAEEKEAQGDELKVVEAKKKLLPSQRDVSGEAIRRADEQLPAYE